jgi:hypothetical protein
MNRRGFLRLALSGVAATAAVRTFPFRVFSFPSEISVARYPLPDGAFDLDLEAFLNRLNRPLQMSISWAPRSRPMIIMHPTELKFLRSLRDKHGQPLWRPILDSVGDVEVIANPHVRPGETIEVAWMRGSVVPRILGSMCVSPLRGA